jgi:hypothetical protein
MPAAPIANPVQPAQPSVIQFAPPTTPQIQIAPQIFVPDVPAGGSNTVSSDDDDMCMQPWTNLRIQVSFILFFGIN